MSMAKVFILVGFSVYGYLAGGGGGSDGELGGDWDKFEKSIPVLRGYLPLRRAASRKPMKGNNLLPGKR